MKNTKDLFLELTKREISIRYKKTIFGFLWMFLNPLSQMAIIGLVFGSFVSLSNHFSNYFIFIFIGLLIWNFFSNTVNKNTSIYVNEGILLHKSNFPREVIALSIIASNGFHFLISNIVFTIYLIGYYLFSFRTSMLLHLIKNFPILIIFLLSLLVLISGLSFLLSAINVKYRDTAFFIGAIMPLWFYASPIVWELKMIPTNWHVLAYLNPLVGIIELARKYFLNIPLTVNYGFYISLVVIIIIFFIGMTIFNKEKKYFDDWI